MRRVEGADSGRDGTAKSRVPSEICMDISYTPHRGVCAGACTGEREREEERKRMRDRYQPRCKFYRPDKSGLVDGARKDTLLCIYIPGVIRYAA